MQNFNLETMSGVYPGSRTRVYQRLRVQTAAQLEPIWAQLQWYADPAAAALLPMRHPQANTPVQLYLPDPQRGDFLPRLQNAATEQGLRLTACFTCRHWRATGLANEDSIPLGHCSWTGQPSHAAPPIPDVLAGQSALSLACNHHSPPATPNLAPNAPSGAPRARAPLRVPKAAELDPDRLPFWPRLLHRARARFRPQPIATPDWTAQLVERSGVGAGTEPCFVCQGRLANLGALAVASPEGDKQTFSVWRCRICHTTYLNDWIDRWERLESLETEERYYRIAPAEAFAALRIIHAETGGEHPAQRARRGHLRAQILELIGQQPPLSHQVRQGR